MNSNCSRRRGIIAGVAMTVLYATGAGADYEAGQAAWDAGRHVEAVAAWQEAAQANDARAMLALGRAFVAGVGVPQDYVEAHKWLNLAAGLGNLDAVAERDALAAEMTVGERAEARGLARAWRTAGAPPVADASPPDTAEAIAAAPSTTGAPPERALREAQTLLATLGYAPGPADGHWGRRSIEAYRRFLGDAGMEPSDVLTPEALRAMREKARAVADAKAAPAVPPDALHQAVQAADLDALAAALAAGREADARDGRGWTPLMHAANLGHVLMVPPLLDAGADVNLRAADGATALFMATALGHTGIIELLSRAGADVSIEGPRGKTAVDVARARYGDADAARASGESPAVQALLQGRTLLDIEAEAAFARAEASGTPAAYENYLAAYPTGRRSEKARAALQELRDIAFFEQAKAQGTAEGYEAYLERLPTGLFADEARRLLNLLDLSATGWQEGRTFRDCGDCPEMVIVAAGSFMMGSPASEEGRHDNEGPEHRVTFRQPFAIAKHEVTFAEFRRFVEETGHSLVSGDPDHDSCLTRKSGDWALHPDVSWRQPGFSQSDTHPVVCVNWKDAKAYVRWLSRRTGVQYRLPSEAEWEYAARAGSRTRYDWGDAIGRNRANCAGCDDRWGGASTSPVGSFAPNAFGLHDLHGNVFEWVEDCWNDSYEGAVTDGGAWKRGDCGKRVCRGGSWAEGSTGLRSAYRIWSGPASRAAELGFRVARTLTP